MNKTDTGLALRMLTVEKSRRRAINEITQEWYTCPTAMISSLQWTYSCGRRRASSANASPRRAYEPPRTSGAVD